MRVVQVVVGLAGLLFVAHSARSQTANAALPSFEIASVKPHPWNGQGGVGITVRGDTLFAEHVSLNDLVLYAYNLRDVQLSGGAAWTDRGQSKLAEAELFQVVAKAGSDVPPVEQFRRMLQALLAERFQLKIHHVQKDMPIYNLVVNNGGPKFKASAPDTKFSGSGTSVGNGVRWELTATTIPRFVAGQIDPYAGRPVIDKTALSGTYDIAFEFAPDNLTVASDAPTLVTALREQLGLRLEAATAPFDTIVIDHVERPSEN